MGYKRQAVGDAATAAGELPLSLLPIEVPVDNQGPSLPDAALQEVLKQFEHYCSTQRQTGAVLNRVAVRRRVSMSVTPPRTRTRGRGSSDKDDDIGTSLISDDGDGGAEACVRRWQGGAEFCIRQLSLWAGRSTALPIAQQALLLRLVVNADLHPELSGSALALLRRDLDAHPPAALMSAASPNPPTLALRDGLWHPKALLPASGAADGDGDGGGSVAALCRVMGCPGGGAFGLLHGAVRAGLTLVTGDINAAATTRRVCSTPPPAVHGGALLPLHLL